MNLKSIRYIDIHSHLGFGDYSQDLKETIQRMEDSGVATITVGTDLESSKEAVKIASENENIWACIGAHPADKRDFVFEEKDFESLVKNPKVVAIGECGLDYFVNPKSKVVMPDGRSPEGMKSEKLKVIFEEEKNRQKKEFIKQIEFAIKYEKPLMLHLRHGVDDMEDAYMDAFDILRNYKNVKGNLHFFTGSLEWAKKFIELGFTISFTGVITFARQYDEVIKNISLDKIHIETDSPYVTPAPYRGKRNEPTYVVEVVKKIAEIRGEDFEMVRKQLLQNSKDFFCI